MGVYTHLLEYSGGVSVVEITNHAQVDRFSRPMRIFDGVNQFAFCSGTCRQAWTPRRP